MAAGGEEPDGGAPGSTDDGRDEEPVPAVELPPPPKTGILKGGKMWKGAAAATAAASNVAPEASEPAKPAAVRFIHLNDAAGDAPDGQQQPGKAAANSAFQQLFPRARKLLQEWPEADGQRAAAARTSSAPVAPPRAPAALLQQSLDAVDLK